MTVEQMSQFQDERRQYQLQLQADQVQKVMGKHGAQATVNDMKAEGRILQFDLREQVTSGLQHLRGLGSDLKAALGVESVRFLNEEGGLQLQVLRPFEPAVALLDLLALTGEVPPATAVLGLTAAGQPMLHTFSNAVNSHVLISGHAQAGKTTLLRTVAASLALSSKQAQVQILGVLPVSSNRERHLTQENALRPLNYLPHMLSDIVTRQTEITELLLFLAREMSYRAEHEFSTPRIVVLIDQAATVMERGGRTVRQAIHSLAQRGAESGIHLVLSTRRPEADVFGTNLKTSIPARFVGRLEMERATENDVTSLDIEATTLLGEGDFLAASGPRGTRFQAAYISDYDLHYSLAQLYRERPILLAQPLDRRVKLGQKLASAKTSRNQSKKDSARRQKKTALEEEDQFSFLDELIPLG